MSALFMGMTSTDWSSLGQLFAAKAVALAMLVIIGLVAQFVCTG